MTTCTCVELVLELDYLKCVQSTDDDLRQSGRPMGSAPSKLNDIAKLGKHQLVRLR